MTQKEPRPLPPAVRVTVNKGAHEAAGIYERGLRDRWLAELYSMRDAGATYDALVAHALARTVDAA